MTQNPGHGPGSSAGEPGDESRAYVPADVGAQRNGSFRANEGGAFRAYGGFAGGAAQQHPSSYEVPGDRPQEREQAPQPEADRPRLPQREPGTNRGPDRGLSAGDSIDPRPAAGGTVDPGPAAGGSAGYGQADRAYSDGGHAGDPYAQRGGQPQQPAYESEPYREQGYQAYDRGGYGQQSHAQDSPAPWETPEAPAYQERYPNEPHQDQRYAPGYADHGYSDHGYPDHEPPADEGYRDRGHTPEPSYQDPRYDGSYSPPAQPGAGYGGESYAQQPGYAYPGYNAGYGRGDYGYNNQQGGYDQQGGYQAGYTATLQLDDGSGRTYQLREGSNVIGRGQEAHFRLPDTGVSRRHFEIRWDGQVAMLGDLGSTNGTSVNGATVQDWQLADGDVVRAGHSDIIVRIA
ncbi:FHA domain-containing protein [Aldersonia kunmingensis]|uniref:FHA domain-containing protein n=1 Tax=Aldersonia kunmingensis TaxID=408066 RepID=UPI001FE0B3D7|nr:FHA domain-containing protein [Aldersonia kunmingensis]